MKRSLPVNFIDLIDNWLKRSFSRVKWDNMFSKIYTTKTGVHQGSVLAPMLFSIAINDTIRACKKSKLGIILCMLTTFLL